MLLGFLDWQRSTVAWKCAGLDAAGLRATLPPSTMSLGGLLAHLAAVEDLWCGQWLHGLEPVVPGDGDPVNEAWSSAAADSPDELVGRWEAAVARSRSLVADALADGGLDRRARLAERWDGSDWVVGPARPEDYPPTLRWILLHLVEEYARHAGHADLLRESIDGLTGE